MCCGCRLGIMGVERQQKIVNFLYSFLFHKFILCVCRRGEQGLVTETPRGEIQIPQCSGKMEADTIVLEFFLLMQSPLIICFSSLNFVGCRTLY